MENLISLFISQHFIIQIILAAFAVLGLWYGSEKVIWSVKRLARKLGISELIIGLTLVSIGSSLPEIFVNISAGLAGADNVGVGNIIGSCFVQTSLILGICVLIAGKMEVSKSDIRRDGPVVLAAASIIFLLGLDGQISRWEAVLLICAYFSYIYLLIYQIKHKENKIKKSFFTRKLAQFLDWFPLTPPHEPAQEHRSLLHFKPSRSPMWQLFLTLFFGGFIVWFSAQILLGIGLNAGEQIGLSDGVIGLISGIGTTIPELSISLMALLRKSNGISVGNLLGSNITDPLFSMQLGAFLAGGYTVSNFLLFTAMPLWIMATFFCIAVFWINGKMTRLPAGILIGFYLVSFYIFLG